MSLSQLSGYLSCQHGISLELLPHLAGVAVEAAELAGGLLCIWAYVRADRAACPRCGHPSGLVHSSYERRLKDAPVGGYRVLIRLGVRRFFCGNPECAAVKRRTSTAAGRHRCRRCGWRAHTRRRGSHPDGPSSHTIRKRAGTQARRFAIWICPWRGQCSTDPDAGRAASHEHAAGRRRRSSSWMIRSGGRSRRSGRVPPRESAQSPTCRQ